MTNRRDHAITAPSGSAVLRPFGVAFAVAGASLWYLLTQVEVFDGRHLVLSLVALVTTIGFTVRGIDRAATRSLARIERETDW